MQDLITSVIRTVTPFIVSAVIVVLTKVGIHAPTTDVTAWVTFGLGGVYYLVVRLLERKWPSLGVFLGVPAKPEYRKVSK